MSPATRDRPRTGVRGLGPLLVAGSLVAGCTGSATATADAIDADDAPAAPVVGEPSASSVAAENTVHRVRDGDTTDVTVLAEQLGEGVEGDHEWIAIVADLRARSWLASRYPGVYDLTDIYDPRWVEATAVAFEQEALSQGVYIDEPLPVLESVVVTREVGWIVEVEVTLVSEQAVIRRSDDDAVVTTLPGGRTRGLFSLGPATPNDTERPWRIHSIVELLPSEDAPPASQEDDQ